ncbi:MAG: 4-hydroxybenzoate octaprenyltransferase [Wenzhouxiangella sp.]
MEFKSQAAIFAGPLGPWLRLMRFDRPIGLALLLWPTWWGLWLAAGGVPQYQNLIIFTLGVIVMRAAGCVINDYADRHLDPRVGRTKDRPIAAGEITPRQALTLFIVLMLIALVLVLLTNRLTILLAIGGALLASTYPFLKRFTHFPQLGLATAFSWAILMAFAAEADVIPALAWWLFAVNLIWTVIYDTQYAMADREDDLKVGVKSTAIAFGRFDVPVIAGLMGLMMALLVLIGLIFLPTPAWFTAVVVVFLLFQIQLWRIRERRPDACFQSFLSNHWIGLVIFAGIAVSFAQR